MLICGEKHLTQQPPTPSQARWTKRITIFVIVCMLITFLAGVATVIWVGLHVLDARHDTLAPAARPAALPKTAQTASLLLRAG